MNTDGKEVLHLTKREVDEQTPLLQYKQPNNVIIHHFQHVHPKQMYTAITLTDIFQKIVFTTIITSFLLFASSFLGCEYVSVLQTYFIFTSFLWLVTAVANQFVDAFLSKYTIIIGFMIFLSGSAILTIFTSNTLHLKLPKLMVLLPLFLICIGEGVCKTFSAEFGSVQFNNIQLPSTNKFQTFTNVLFWIGNTCAVLLILFFLAICEIYNFQVAIGLCCVCLIIAMLCFGIGWKSFRKPDEKKSAGLGLLLSIISNARLSKNQINVPIAVEHWLDFAVLENGGKYSKQEVNEAKHFLKVISIFFALIPYWICNAQSYGTFIYQGFYLNMKISNTIFVPVSWTALSNIAAALLFLKFAEKVIYRSRCTCPVSWRIILGMLFVCLSMCAAGTVQLFSHFDVGNSGTHLIGKTNMTYVPNVHILYTIPQYMFLGISEVLVGLTVLTLGFKLCPKIFKKLVFSSYYFMIAVGHLISLGLISMGWFPSETFLDGYCMVIYFFSLGGSAILGILMFIFVVSEKCSHESSVNA